MKKTPADFSLQARIGAGSFDQKRVVKAQEKIQNNDIDFTPLIAKYLIELNSALQKYEANDFNDSEDIIAAFTLPMMQIKANAKFCGYDLVGNLSDIMLVFMESVVDVDQNMIETILIYKKTLHDIMMKQIQGDVKAYGQKIQNELTKACQRYCSNVLQNTL